VTSGEARLPACHMALGCTTSPAQAVPSASVAAGTSLLSVMETFPVAAQVRVNFKIHTTKLKNQGFSTGKQKSKKQN